ncbi:Peptidase S1, PA clan [Sergentomyia squamirostris]
MNKLSLVFAVLFLGVAIGQVPPEINYDEVEKLYESPPVDPLMGVFFEPDGLDENPEFQSRVVGGSSATSAAQFPYQASLRTAGNAHFCGATIIGSRTVLSAAHCTVGRGQTAVRVVWAQLTVLTNADCRNRHTANNRPMVFDHKICTFTRTGQGICMGDSGGPLVIGSNVIGIPSWVIPCARGFPDVYDRVSSHRNWIISVM